MAQEEYVSPFRDMHTAARHRWLAAVDAAGFRGLERMRGRTGYECNRLGLTQWKPVEGAGQQLYEELTPMGQQALKEWNDEHGQPPAEAGAAADT